MTKPAQTYDEIVRKTVPEPDTSMRAAVGQETVRVLDELEQMLYARVVDSLLGIADIDPSGISVQIARDHVTLRGQVSQAAQLDRIERQVHAVPGVGVVVNYLVVGASEGRSRP
jgi:hypothetical protein